MGLLAKLPNLGPVNEEKLNAAGIMTPEQLRELGSIETLRRVHACSDPNACLHMLYALEGAIEGIPKKQLAQDTRERLKAAFVRMNQ